MTAHHWMIVHRTGNFMVGESTYECLRCRIRITKPAWSGHPTDTDLTYADESEDCDETRVAQVMES